NSRLRCPNYTVDHASQLWFGIEAKWWCGRKLCSQISSIKLDDKQLFGAQGSSIQVPKPADLSSLSHAWRPLVEYLCTVIPDWERELPDAGVLLLVSL